MPHPATTIVLKLLSNLSGNVLATLIADWIKTGVIPTVTSQSAGAAGIASAATIAAAATGIGLTAPLMLVGGLFAIPTVIDGLRDDAGRRRLLKSLHDLAARQGQVERGIADLRDTLDGLNRIFTDLKLPGFEKASIGEFTVRQLAQALAAPDSESSTSLDRAVMRALGAAEVSLHDLAIFLNTNHIHLVEISALAKLLPGARVREETSLTHVRSVTSLGDIPIKLLLADPSPLALDIDLANASLLYGPPRIGKTCWSVRRAIDWLDEHHGRAEAYYIDSKRRDPGDLMALARCVITTQPLLFIIDDIHFRPERRREWVGAVADVASARTGSLSVLWISRAADDARELPVHAPRQIVEFPTEELARQFMHSIPGLGRGHGVIAAVASRLDPELLRLMQDRCEATCAHSHQDVVELVQQQERDATARWLDRVPAQAMDAYVTLLPAASLDLTLPGEFYDHIMGGTFSLQYPDLLRAGLAYETAAGDVGLVEHPFQVQRTLRHRRRAGTAGSRGKFGTVIAEVFGNYIFDSGVLSTEHLTQLQHYAEWSGVREVLARALRELTSEGRWWASLGDRREALSVQLKLERLLLLRDRIEGGMFDVHLAWWSEELAVAAASNDPQGKGFRRDYILYEIGYLHYLKGEFDRAEECMRASVAAGVECIGACMTAEHGIGSAEWSRGAMAFANIWVGLNVCAYIQMATLLAAWYEHGPSEDVRRDLLDLARSQTSLYQNLRNANEHPEKASGVLYHHALCSVLPEASLLDPTLLDRPEPAPNGSSGAAAIRRVRQFLGDKEMNAWLNAIVIRATPSLYGVADERLAPAEDLAPNRLLRRTLRFSERNMELSRSRHLYLSALHEWESKRNARGIEGDVLAAAVLYAADGQVEELAQKLFFAWRTTSDNAIADAIAWLLEEYVVEVGPGLASVQAMRALDARGERRVPGGSE